MAKNKGVVDDQFARRDTGVMKILMLGWELPPHNSGGLGVACYHLSKAMAIEGAEIDFVVPYQADHDAIDFMTMHHATGLGPLQRNGIGAYESSAAGASDDSDLGDIRGVQRQYQRFAQKLAAEKEFDAIHAHDWLTLEAGVLVKQQTNKPLIVHVHATEFDRAGGIYGNPIVHEIEQQGLMMADRILAVSEITRQIIIGRYGIPADKVEVMHNAIDVESLNDGYAYDVRTYRYLEELRSEGYTIISTLTRFTVQKGLEYLVQAFAKATQKYDRLVLLLAGDGEQRDELIALASKLGVSDKVFFTGFVRGKQWRDAYSVSDVFVLSSVSEPFGLTALEAAHHDNALIITKQSGVGEVLNNTLKYDFWDVERLADQIVGIATSPALESSLKENVYKEYAKVSWQDIARRCMKLYGVAQKKREVALV